MPNSGKTVTVQKGLASGSPAALHARNGPYVRSQRLKLHGAGLVLVLIKQLIIDAYLLWRPKV